MQHPVTMSGSGETTFCGDGCCLRFCNGAMSWFGKQCRASERRRLLSLVIAKDDFATHGGWVVFQMV